MSSLIILLLTWEAYKNLADHWPNA
ncbi:hypothetical protein PM8797T_00547 [Gimesia maris DSM 8797]|nr:hypothetical protein PM8797T_00547 [Gimesia maris DSM 8797]